jgi:hypothetical protein
VNRRCLAGALAGAALLLLAGARPAAAQVTGPALKAAFILNFVKFTEWPEAALAPGAPLVLCVSDTDVARELETLTSGQVVDGRRLVVRRTGPHDAGRDCTVAYVHDLDRQEVRAWIARRPGGTLTVSDVEDFAQYGGIVELFVDAGRMRFAVNRRAAEQSRLRLSSRVLSLARLVKN